MQSYVEVASSETLAASLAELLNNDKTALSCNSGTAFPTLNLQVGMLCDRTDQSKIYKLKDSTPTWVLLTDYSGGAALVALATSAAACTGNAASATTAAACSGNAATATALSTVRTIDGAPFDGSANIAVVAPATHAATSKATPVDADEFGYLDSAAGFGLVRATWANIKATLKTYFDTLYTSLAIVVSTANNWTKGQAGAITALTDAVVIAVDLALANNFKVTLAGNRTLGNPSNIVPGQSGIIAVTQDAIGTRTLAFSGYYKFGGGTAPVLTTTANAVDYLSYYVESATQIFIGSAKDIK